MPVSSLSPPQALQVLSPPQHCRSCPLPSTANPETLPQHCTSFPATPGLKVGPLSPHCRSCLFSAWDPPFSPPFQPILLVAISPVLDQGMGLSVPVFLHGLYLQAHSRSECSRMTFNGESCAIPAPSSLLLAVASIPPS